MLLPDHLGEGRRAVLPVERECHEATLRGRTDHPVQAEISVVRTGAGVDVSGSVPVTFGDYGIDAPNLGFVRVDDQGAVEFFLRLTL